MVQQHLVLWKVQPPCYNSTSCHCVLRFSGFYSQRHSGWSKSKLQPQGRTLLVHASRHEGIFNKDTKPMSNQDMPALYILRLVPTNCFSNRNMFQTSPGATKKCIRPKGVIHSQHVIYWPPFHDKGQELAHPGPDNTTGCCTVLRPKYNNF
jgi:hypothetical protein